MTDKILVHATDDELNGKAVLKVEWDNFKGSVLDMKEQDFIYAKEKMIEDEFNAVAKLHDYAFYKTGDMYPRDCWFELEQSSKEHLEKLKEFKERVVKNNP